MEPERPIEKLLRDAGKKRASGRTVELHPATRRMLQGEVIRQFGKREDKTHSISSVDRLVRWWPRISWSFGVLLGLVGAALLMVPRQQQSREMAMGQSKRALETNDRDRGGSPALAGSTGSADKQQVFRAPSATAPTVPAAPPDSSASAAVKLADTVSHEAMNEPTRPAAPALTQVPAAFGGQLAAREISGYTTAQPPAALNSTLAPSAAAAPATPAPVLAWGNALHFAGTTTTIDSERRSAGFVQGFNRDADEKKEAPKGTSRPVLLTSFAFELNGNEVRIVDADGSVYSGSLQRQGMAEDPLKEGEASKAKTLGLSQGARARVESAPTRAATAKQASAADVYNFYVTGTNRSLSAKVDFTGSITGVTNLLSSRANKEPQDGFARDDAAGRATNALKLNLQPARISGKAVIGDKQLLDVKASATQR
jgi:hypothetical protein